MQQWLHTDGLGFYSSSVTSIVSSHRPPLYLWGICTAHQAHTAVNQSFAGAGSEGFFVYEIIPTLRVPLR